MPKIDRDDCIILTRPLHQQRLLAKRLATQGYKTLQLPLIEIEPLLSTSFALYEQMGVDKIIVTSPNAVFCMPDECLSCLKLCSLSVPVFAIGLATAKALKQAGICVHGTPPSSGSESLLASGILGTVEGMKILIIKGDEGRFLLPKSLMEKGALVSHMDVYRRLAPDHLSPITLKLWKTLHTNSVLMLTSTSALSHLLALAGSHLHWIKECKVLVSSQRLKEAAKASGFREHRIILAPGASDEELLEVFH